MSKTFCQVKLKDISYKLFYLEDRYFPPPWYIHLLYFFLNIYVHIFISRKECIDSINYLIKISILLVFIIFLNLPFRCDAQRDAASWRLDRSSRSEAWRHGANRNQSIGIQFIHAKRLTHHPNTRYTLLVMDSCKYLIPISSISTAKCCFPVNLSYKSKKLNKIWKFKNPRWQQPVTSSIWLLLPWKPIKHYVVSLNWKYKWSLLYVPNSQVNRMNCIESRRGGDDWPPPLKASCNYFFFEASSVNTRNVS